MIFIVSHQLFTSVKLSILIVLDLLCQKHIMFQIFNQNQHKNVYIWDAKSRLTPNVLGLTSADYFIQGTGLIYMCNYVLL